MKKTKRKYKKNKTKNYKQKKYSRKAKGKDFYDSSLWGWENVAKHRDQIVEYPEKKSILKTVANKLPNELVEKIIGSPPKKSLHIFLKDDIERMADKIQRYRNKNIQSHQTHRYKRVTQ